MNERVIKLDPLNKKTMKTITKEKKKKVRQRAFNRRTFSGCVTCRRRKVKCDGRRPKCLRCEKSKKECSGYGFKLKFCDLNIVQQDGSMGVFEMEENSDGLTKRQQLTLMKFPKEEEYETFEEIDKILEKIPDEIDTKNSFNIGPFGLFSLNDKNQYYLTFEKSLTSLNKHKTPVVYAEAKQLENDSENSTNRKKCFQQFALNLSTLDSKNTSLPSISSIININNNIALDKVNPGTTIVDNKLIRPVSHEKMTRIIPLVPALELQHNRRKQQNKHDMLKNSLANSQLINQQESELSHIKNENNHIIPKPVWIHPRLEIDAILTYQALVGSADVLTESWDLVKRVIFAEKYNFTLHLKNRIIDKMDLNSTEINKVVEKYVVEVVRALNENSLLTSNVTTFSSLLRLHKVQELIRIFVKSQPSVMILSFNGCVFDTIVIPSLYKIVGELMVFECSMGLPGDWEGNVSDGGIQFRKYCDILKRTFCMVALSITSFLQYKSLFNEYGIYDGSLKLFKCYIAFRNMSIANLSLLIKPLIELQENGIGKMVNFGLLNRLIKLGLFKELILTFLLAIYQDSNLDIIINYSLLYSVLDGIYNYYQTLNNKDPEMDLIWEWFRYLSIFYRSCSKIDVYSYEIQDEGFEDVNSDYNLIKKFKFDDYFDQNEYNKIEIKPKIIQTGILNNLHHISSNDQGVIRAHSKKSVENAATSLEEGEPNTNVDNCDEEVENSHNHSDIAEQMLEIPKRLQSRPDIIDKPPRSFTVSFHFAEDHINEENESDEDYNAGDDLTIDNHLTNMKPLLGPNRGNCDVTKSFNKISTEKKDDKKYINNESILKTNHKTKRQIIINQSGVEIDSLTGLTVDQSVDMTLKEREQVFDKKGKIRVPHPLDIDWENSNGRPSIIELSFGIPISLLELIERTVKLADHKNWCLRKKIFPRNFPKFCCDLEDELTNWKLEWDLYSDERTQEGELQFYTLFHKTLYHLTIAFYNSILVFFFRLIKEINPNLLQDHVITTITHLEQLRTLTLRSDFLKDMKIHPPFWCFFISGSDAVNTDLQYRYDELARKWFVAGNKWIGKQIMFEVWRVRNLSHDNSEIEENSWLDIIKDWEISGFN